MKKMLFMLGAAFLLFAPTSQSSFSAKVNAYQQNKASTLSNSANSSDKYDKAGSVIVACACKELFPVVEELTRHSKDDIKELVKELLGSISLNESQLSSFKLMVHDAAELIREGIRIGKPLVIQHGKDICAILQAMCEYNIALEQGKPCKKPQPADSMYTIFQDEQWQPFLEKVALFNEKWAEPFASIMQMSAAGKRIHDSQKAGALLQKVTEYVSVNKRAINIYSLLIPALSCIKTKIDGLRMVQACFKELESQLPALLISTEQFADFALPFLASTVGESVDEILQNMPA